MIPFGAADVEVGAGAPVPLVWPQLQAFETLELDAVDWPGQACVNQYGATELDADADERVREAEDREDPSRELDETGAVETRRPTPQGTSDPSNC